MNPGRTSTTALLVLVALALVSVPAWPQTAGDADNDGLPDAWETRYGLDPTRNSGDNGGSGDPDRDGLTNANELALGSHPRSFATRTFAEGATGPFFDARFALFNPDAKVAARVLVRYLTSDGRTVPFDLALAAGGRATLDPETLPGLENAAFSTVVESDLAIVVDRTMSWDATHYGSHAETGTQWPSTTWFLAEGATHSSFDLFYLLQNPNPEPTVVEVTYLLPSGTPLVKSYALAAGSRFNVWVNHEDPLLAATDVSAVIVSRDPIVVERAMYLSRPGRLFDAGTASTGMTSPALTWFLAEGATGDLFDLFVLIANPNPQPAAVEITYLLPGGGTVVRTRTVGARSRFTVWVDLEDAALANTAVSTIVKSTNGVPILVERAMWWPGWSWQEAHNSAGTTAASTKWALAEGEVGGADNVSTYVLIANVASAAGAARITLYFEGGGTATRDLPLQPRSRETVDIGASFPDARGRRFGTIVESLAPAPVSLVVERAMYSDSSGQPWAAGTNAVGTPLGPIVAQGTGTTALPVVTVWSDDATATEQGQKPARVTIARSSNAGALTVAFSLVGTASPADFGAVATTVSFAAGEAAKSVQIVPVDDGEREPDETLVVALAHADGYTVGRQATVLVTLIDDDTRPGDGEAPSSGDAVRFLNQASFGPTWALLREVQAKGLANWIDDQTNAPRSGFQGYLDLQVPGLPAGQTLSQNQLQEAWFEAAISGPDQLRQRVANALLEILVVSSNGSLGGRPYALAHYMDLLMAHAFGNFRTLMEQVTLSPAMGDWLDMLQNRKEDTRTGRNPNENYARELLQLFTIGLYQLNLDGTHRLDPTTGQPMPTYDQPTVEGFAKVFTGWTYWQPAAPYNFYPSTTNDSWRNLMISMPTFHSTSAKPLLGGVTIAATTVSDPAADLKVALDNIFNHANVGPFVVRQLIQRLVSSNPSPAYVARVATVFNDNGGGVRGDLRAVVKAILLDEEARSPQIAAGANFGHLREPMVRFVSSVRAFGGKAASGKFRVHNLQNNMAQAPFRAPSVFNFYEPDWALPGPVADASLQSPEFKITTDTTVIQSMNTIRGLVYNGYGSGQDQIRLDFTGEQTLAADPGGLLDRLDLLLFGGTLSAELRQTVREAIVAVPATSAIGRVRTAVYLLLTSPEYSIQK